MDSKNAHPSTETCLLKCVKRNIYILQRFTIDFIDAIHIIASIHDFAYKDLEGIYIYIFQLTSQKSRFSIRQYT